MDNKGFKTVEALGFHVFSDSMEKIPEPTDKCAVISTINPIVFGTSTKDPVFRLALQKADYLMLDGVYFALSSFILYGKTIKKNQGPEIFDFFMKKAHVEGKRIFFMGGSEATLQKMKLRAEKELPNIAAIATYSPPYKPEFSDEDNQLMIEKINNFAPDYLFIGLTAPKQEKWAYLNSPKLTAKFAISIGGVFDWYSGDQKAIAPIWWKLRLAWLIRTINRPEILKRYPRMLIFCKHVILARLGFEKYKYGKF